MVNGKAKKKVDDLIRNKNQPGEGVGMSGGQLMRDRGQHGGAGGGVNPLLCAW